MKRIATLLLLLAVAVVPAFAAGGHHGPPAGFAGPGAGGPPSAAQHLGHLAKALDLTADQLAAAKPLADALDAAVAPLFAQAKTQRQAVEAALTSNADAATVGEAVIAEHATKLQIKAAHDKFATAFTALLTPDQATKFAELHAHMEHGGHGPR